MNLLKVLSMSLLLASVGASQAAAEGPESPERPEAAENGNAAKGPAAAKSPEAAKSGDDAKNGDAATAAESAGWDTLCPDLPAKKAKKAKAYAIGSSTMGSILGPILKNAFKKEGIALNRWGKASTGLARPDFHDWPKLAPGLMHKHKPQIVVVSLGTNDFQPIYHKKKWIKWGAEEWETIYAARMDKMLKILGGKKMQRLVLWTGPTAFKGKKAKVRAPVVNRIMKARVQAYAKAGGRAIYLDAYAKTSDSKGRPLSKAKLPGYKRSKSIRTPDGIHLTADAVRALMADPVMDVVRQCKKVQAKREAIRAKAAAEKAVVGVKNGG